VAASRLARLAFELERLGLPHEELMLLHAEAAALERPPSLAGRLGAQASQLARSQWARVLGEWQESRDAWRLLQRRASGGPPLSPEEEDQLRDQLLDLLRLVPAGIVASASFAIPLPGAFLLTPALLSRLGLLPSRWREARLTARLQDEVERVRAAGQEGLAQRLSQIRAELEEEAEARERVARDAALLRSWDQDGDGKWSPEERAVYLRAVEEVAARAAADGESRRWFVLAEDRVFGPTRLAPLLALESPGALLVRPDVALGWVALADLQRAVHEAAPKADALFEADTLRIPPASARTRLR
jgi:hypothetical protein